MRSVALLVILLMLATGCELLPGSQGAEPTRRPLPPTPTSLLPATQTPTLVASPRPTGSPTTTPLTTTTTTPTALGPRAVIYFTTLMPGIGVVPVGVLRSLSRQPRSVEERAQLTAEALLQAKPSVDEAKGGLTTSVPAQASLRGLRVQGQVAALDMAAPGTTQADPAFLLQLLFTLVELEGVNGVTVQLNGQPVWSSPVIPADLFGGSVYLKRHVLQDREEFRAVAQTLGISQRALLRSSGLSPDADAAPGQQLAAYFYLVEPGDTMTRLARRFATTVVDLVEANSLSDPNRVVSGQPLALPSQPPSQELSGAAIIVDQPSEGDSIASPVTVSGWARVFEGAVEAEVRDPSNQVLGRGFTTASAGAPRKAPFRLTITFPQPVSAQRGAIAVFSRNPRDGSIVNLVTSTVTLAAK
ncbi:MAG: LysM peptidoglycan-binding domain-containing protein [Chloroflexi bacterium]|nr:LysM peptidoglycan-binding domain-containing protein [Chloroflexota bacterium]